MMGWKMESSLFGRFVINLVFLTVFLYVSSPPLRSLSHLSLSFSVFCSESSMETDVMRKKQETGPCFVRQARSPKIVIMLRTVKRPTDYDKTKLFSFRRAATKVFNYSTSCASNRTKFRRRVLFNLEDCLVA